MNQQYDNFTEAFDRTLPGVRERITEDYHHFSFPTPPSVNAAYKDTVRKRKAGGYFCVRSDSKAKRVWQTEARRIVWEQPAVPPTGSLWGITLIVGLDNERADVDGPVKLAIDLVASRLGLNDKDIQWYDVYRLNGETTTYVEVETYQHGSTEETDNGAGEALPGVPDVG